jgi:hypothetical protein
MTRMPLSGPWGEPDSFTSMLAALPDYHSYGDSL